MTKTNVLKIMCKETTIIIIQSEVEALKKPNETSFKTCLLFKKTFVNIKYNLSFPWKYKVQVILKM